MVVVAQLSFDGLSKAHTGCDSIAKRSKDEWQPAGLGRQGKCGQSNARSYSQSSNRNGSQPDWDTKKKLVKGNAKPCDRSREADDDAVVVAMVVVVQVGVFDGKDRK